MDTGFVVALHRKPESGGVEAADELEAVQGSGFVGDKCAGRPIRQVLLLSSETLDEFGYEPGQLREQVTVQLPGLQALPIGTLVQAGSAVFRIEMDCAPCAYMARELGENEDEFRARLAGKRGMLATVAQSGRLRVGDEVIVRNG